MNVVRHDDKGVEEKPALNAVTVKGLEKQVGVRGLYEDVLPGGADDR